MPLFALKSLSRRVSLPQPEQDHKTSQRAERYRFSSQAIYYPSFPGTAYLPFAAVTKLMVRSTSLAVTGSCGKSLPMVCLRMYYDGADAFQDFIFEKEKISQKVEDACLAANPAVLLDKKLSHSCF